MENVPPSSRTMNEKNVKKAPGSGQKNMDVSSMYQKKTQLEHVLLRPDSYIGSVEANDERMWVLDDQYVGDEDEDDMDEEEKYGSDDEYDDEGNKKKKKRQSPKKKKNAALAHIRIVQRPISYVPGLYKIYDEILVNAADNRQRDATTDVIKVEINAEKGFISVYNNGAGIPVQLHSEHQVYIPELIFGHLLTSSNYDDNNKKTTGGRNGFGAKLANIFSTKFVIETQDSVRNLLYKQVFRDNMHVKETPIITQSNKPSWTKVTFWPDFAKFGLTGLNADHIALMKRRVYDLAGTNDKSLKVYLNGERIPVKGFKEYVQLYLTKQPGEEAPPPMVHEVVNERWEVACSVSSEAKYQQVSFVNSIATSKGGTHEKLVTNQIVNAIYEHINKKHKAANVKKPHVQNHLFVFVNCLIENPAFDSQTKVNLTSQPKSFGSKCELSEKFIKQLLKSDVVNKILSFSMMKNDKELKKNDGKKKGRLSGIAKLDDANDAGGKHGHLCTLILTEGDSAKALAVSGLSVVGRDRYGVFPLKGKLLNVREASHKQIMANSEVTAIKQILGLAHGKEYTDAKSLRYGHIMLMTDQDHDGSHIKGLVINLFSHFWPSLLRLPGFITEFITPIVKCTKGRQVHTFYTIPEYENWKRSTGNDGKGWTIKYYKGLGTSTAQEAKEYFSEIDRHQIDFVYRGPEDDTSINMAFSKSHADARKDWIAAFQPGTYFNQDEHELNYNNFIHKELILFSVASNLRAIPSIVDGLKPGQRKIIFSCFKRNLTKEIKVAQLAGYVSEHSAYHHGEASLTATIVGLAQNFVGSNNINILFPSGQFGTRLQGGKDSASARYIFTYMCPIARALFPVYDDPLLNYLNDDGQAIEPEWYMPVIPTVLVNGSSGIGTGWSSNVPNYNPRDLMTQIRRMLAGQEMEPIHPWYKGFSGQMVFKGHGSYGTRGIIEKKNETTLVITELPIGKWTQDYKAFLESLIEALQIKDFKEHHTDTTVSFTITVTEDQMRIAETAGLIKHFKLSTPMNTSNMVLFDAQGKLKKYASANEILSEFVPLRMSFYEKRKQHLANTLTDELTKLSNRVRFILAVIKDEMKIRNVKKQIILEQLVRDGYKPFPKKKKAVVVGDLDAEADASDDAESDDPAESKASDYDYLLSMPLWSLTMEKVNTLKAERDAKEAELQRLLATDPKDMWLTDLDALEAALQQHEIIEAMTAAKDAAMGKKKGGPTKKASKKTSKFDDDYDSDDMSYTKKRAPKSTTAPIITRQPQQFLVELSRTPVKKEKKEKVEKPEKKEKEEKSPKRTKKAPQDGVLVEKKEKPQKKLAKKQSTLDSYLDHDDIIDIDIDSDIDDVPVSPMQRQPRRAAAKINYNEEDDDIVDEDEGMVDGGEDDVEMDGEGGEESDYQGGEGDDYDEKPAKASKPKAAKPASKAVASKPAPAAKKSITYDDDEEAEYQPAPLPLAERLKAAQTTTTTTSSLSSLSAPNTSKAKKDVIELSDDEEPAPKPRAARKPKAPKEEKKEKAKPAKRDSYAFDEDDDGDDMLDIDDEYSPVKKAPKPRAKAADKDKPVKEKTVKATKPKGEKKEKEPKEKKPKPAAKRKETSKKADAPAPKRAKKRAASDDESDDEDFGAVAARPASRPQRARAVQSYAGLDDDDDAEFDAIEEDDGDDAASDYED